MNGFNLLRQKNIQLDKGIGIDFTRPPQLGLGYGAEQCQCSTRAIAGTPN